MSSIDYLPETKRAGYKAGRSGVYLSVQSAYADYLQKNPIAQECDDEDSVFGKDTQWSVFRRAFLTGQAMLNLEIEQSLDRVRQSAARIEDPTRGDPYWL